MQTFWKKSGGFFISIKSAFSSNIQSPKETRRSSSVKLQSSHSSKMTWKDRNSIPWLYYKFFYQNTCDSFKRHFKHFEAFNNSEMSINKLKTSTKNGKISKPRVNWSWKLENFWLLQSENSFLDFQIRQFHQ